MTDEAPDVAPEDLAERGDVDEPFVGDASAPAVDLSIDVRKRGLAEKSFTVTVTSPHLDELRAGKVEQWELDAESAAEFVKDHMAQFSGPGQSAANRTALLTGAGIELFEGSPAVFRDAYWKLVDAGAPVRTVLVTSGERSIPWELMVPTRDGVDAFGGPEPLGARYVMARWFQTKLPPPEPTPLADARVVAPAHAGKRPLAKAADEAKLVCTTFQGSILKPALVGDIDTQLGVWDGTLLHFVCHGEAPSPVAQVLLLDGSERLYSTAVKGMGGVRAALASGRALVFLNACKVGDIVPAFAGPGGFAYEFVVRGARAVVAPLWGVDDTIAFEFATAFYKSVVSSPERPFADIVRELRTRAYAPGGGEDTWAAYCFYGDPWLSAAV